MSGEIKEENETGRTRPRTVRPTRGGFANGEAGHLQASQEVAVRNGIGFCRGNGFSPGMASNVVAGSLQRRGLESGTCVANSHERPVPQAATGPSGTMASSHGRVVLLGILGLNLMAVGALAAEQGLEEKLTQLNAMMSKGLISSQDYQTAKSDLLKQFTAAAPAAPNPVAPRPAPSFEVSDVLRLKRLEESEQRELQFGADRQFDNACATLMESEWQANKPPSYPKFYRCLRVERDRLVMQNEGLFGKKGPILEIPCGEINDVALNDINRGDGYQPKFGWNGWVFVRPTLFPAHRRDEAEAICNALVLIRSAKPPRRTKEVADLIGQLLRAIENESHDSAEIEKLCGQIGMIYGANGNYTEAKYFFRKALAVCRGTAPDPARLRYPLNLLAWSCFQAQDYGCAAEQFLPLIAILESTPGVPPQELAACYHAATISLASQGQLSEAAASLSKFEAILASTPEARNDPETLRKYTEMKDALQRATPRSGGPQ